MHECQTCKTISLLLGKKYMMPLLGHHYPKVTFSGVQNYLNGLDLEIVGGLRNRGWSFNDVDVIGNRSDAQILDFRLKGAGIANPVHWCADRISHSHIQCAYYGIKLAFTGKGY